jgi:broad specificity phosphatase PhoE
MSAEYTRFSDAFFAKLDRQAARQSVAILIRHADRDALSRDDVGYALPITETGKQRAHGFGKKLGSRLVSLHTSPFVRCIQTAEAMKAGAMVDAPLVLDKMLGDPGVYVLDGQVAWPTWQKMGSEEVVEHLVTSDIPLPGMSEPNAAAERLIRHMKSIATATLGVHVFVTHDAIIATTAAKILNTSSRYLWPCFLEGAIFWFDDLISMDYRDLQLQLDWT